MCINVVLYGASNIFAFIHGINRYLLILDYGRKLKGISNIMQCAYRGNKFVSNAQVKTLLNMRNNSKRDHQSNIEGILINYYSLQSPHKTAV
jgi:hypothetical protein